MNPKTRKPRRVAVGAPEFATTWRARSGSNDMTRHAQVLAAIAMLDAAREMLDHVAALSDSPRDETVIAADLLDAARDALLGEAIE